MTEPNPHRAILHAIDGLPAVSKLFKSKSIAETEAAIATALSELYGEAVNVRIGSCHLPASDRFAVLIKDLSIEAP
ncbi:MAG TPA: hypothetical protein H9906_03155 [Candidatus Paenalcaligenes intestinipullorum]|uniref:Uncharacterized protein n=1 Tax=Candidatus Paenalcaligenes intestinipullorum TaxID=2838718 RepID=A0A9D2RFB3_9BURK|nr:hypothetical protein [Candidatus Paenalcaligenes intestinipullorum]